MPRRNAALASRYSWLATSWRPRYTDGNNCHSDKSSILSMSIRYAAQFSLASLRSVLVRLGEFWCPPLIVPMIFYCVRTCTRVLVHV